MLLICLPSFARPHVDQHRAGLRINHIHLMTRQAAIPYAVTSGITLPRSLTQQVGCVVDVGSEPAHPVKNMCATCPPKFGDSRAHRVAQRFLCYGDSVTAGFCDGGRFFQPYGKVLAEVLANGGVPCEATVYGLSGLTAMELASKTSAVAIQDLQGKRSKGLTHALAEDGPFDLAFILAGTNDIGLGMPPQAVVQHLSKLHAACHERGVATVAIAPPTQLAGPARAARDHVARLLASWAHATSNVIAYFDSEELLPHGRNGFWEPDEIHLSAAGSIELGRKLAPRVAPLLAQVGNAAGAA